MQPRCLSQPRQLALIPPANDKTVNRRPILIIVLGVCAAGKSTVAQEIYQRLPFSILLDTDHFPVPQPSSIGEIADNRLRYHVERDAVYRHMIEIARLCLVSGQDVIWCQALTLNDGCLPGVAGGRSGLYDLAKQIGIGVAIVHCTATNSDILTRLRKRSRASRSGKPWPDIFRDMLKRWEPIDRTNIRVNTSQKINCKHVLDYIEYSRDWGQACDSVIFNLDQ